MVRQLPATLSDGDLTAAMTRLVRSERQTTAELIAHLAEFEARRLHLAAGFESLFLYCTQVLRLSEHEAYNRIEAARAARRYPRILELLAEGAMNLTTVRLLSPHLTDENQDQLLTESSGMSKRDVEKLLARHFPSPDAAFSIRKLPTPRPDSGAPAARASASTVADVGNIDLASAADAGNPTRPDSDDVRSAPVTTIAAPARREVLRPLAEDRYEIRFTASAAACEKLRAAKDLLRHAIPGGDTGEIIDRALTALLEELARKKFAATSRPGQTAGSEGSSRHIPAAVKRTVWARDAGRCAFVARNGHRCEARGFIEFHHVHPYAVGGPPTIGNIELRCQAHNAYEADLFYGSHEPLAQSHPAKDRRADSRLVPERVVDDPRPAVLSGPETPHRENGPQ